MPPFLTVKNCFPAVVLARRHDRRVKERDGQDAGVRRADADAAETRTRPVAVRGFGADPRNRRPDTTVFQKSRSTVPPE